MSQLTLLEIAKRVLQEEKRPLSPDEIWEIAKQKGYDQLAATRGGKTPARAMGAQMYIDIRDNLNTPFLKAGLAPRRFALKSDFSKQQVEQKVKDQEQQTVPEPTFKEKDLHPLLAYFASLFLRTYTKTINHSRSSKKEFGEWVHPDMVGCYFPIGDWRPEVIDFGTAIGSVSLRLYSFELKRTLDFSNLREAFFQTVSNSSWANEGYLVAAEIAQDDDFRAELQRLSASFGIGIIELRLDDPNSSDILYPARAKEYLDWETINKLSSMNSDFQEFLRRIKNDLMSKEVIKEKYDRVPTAEELIISLAR